MSHPYVILGLAALSFALGQSGPLIMRRPGILRFAWGLLLQAALFVGERATWALFAWLLGTAATDFVASFGDLFTIICLGSLPLLFAGISFAPHLGPPHGHLYVISFFRCSGRASRRLPSGPPDSVVRVSYGCAARSVGGPAVARVEHAARPAARRPTLRPPEATPCRGAGPESPIQR